MSTCRILAKIKIVCIPGNEYSLFIPNHLNPSPYTVRSKVDFRKLNISKDDFDQSENVI